MNKNVKENTLFFKKKVGGGGRELSCISKAFQKT